MTTAYDIKKLKTVNSKLQKKVNAKLVNAKLVCLAQGGAFPLKKEIDDIELPSLLKEGFSVTRHRWIVYLIANKSNHVYIAWEGLHSSRQRFFGEADLTTNSSIILPKMEVNFRWGEEDLKATPNWFENTRKKAYIVPIYAERKRVKLLIESVLKDRKFGINKYWSYGRIRFFDKITKTTNCFLWATDKIREYLNLPVYSNEMPGGSINLNAAQTLTEPHHAVLPSKIVESYAKVTHAKAMENFVTRLKLDPSKLDQEQPKSVPRRPPPSYSYRQEK